MSAQGAIGSPPSAGAGPASSRWRFLLYVAGMSAADQRALASLRQICEEHLPGAHELEVVDLHECPHRAIEDNIFALPTLVRLEPLPVRKLVGDLNEVRDLLATLDLVPTPPESDGEGSAR